MLTLEEGIHPVVGDVDFSLGGTTSPDYLLQFPAWDVSDIQTDAALLAPDTVSQQVAIEQFNAQLHELNASDIQVYAFVDAATGQTLIAYHPEAQKPPIGYEPLVVSGAIALFMTGLVTGLDERIDQLPISPQAIQMLKYAYRGLAGVAVVSITAACSFGAALTEDGGNGAEATATRPAIATIFPYPTQRPTSELVLTETPKVAPPVPPRQTETVPIYVPPTPTRIFPTIAPATLEPTVAPTEAAWLTLPDIGGPDLDIEEVHRLQVLAEKNLPAVYARMGIIDQTSAQINLIYHNAHYQMIGEVTVSAPTGDKFTMNFLVLPDGSVRNLSPVRAGLTWGFSESGEVQQTDEAGNVVAKFDGEKVQKVTSVQPPTKIAKVRPTDVAPVGAFQLTTDALPDGLENAKNNGVFSPWPAFKINRQYAGQALRLPESSQYWGIYSTFGGINSDGTVNLITIPVQGLGGASYSGGETIRLPSNLLVERFDSQTTQVTHGILIGDAPSGERVDVWVDWNTLQVSGVVIVANNRVGQ